MTLTTLCGSNTQGGIQASTAKTPKIVSLANQLEGIHSIAYDLLMAQREIADQFLGTEPEKASNDASMPACPGVLNQLEESLFRLRNTLESIRIQQLRFTGTFN